MREIVFIALLALTSAAGRAADSWQRIDDADAAVTSGNKPDAAFRLPAPVYRALVNGTTADCWGSFTEGYDPNGQPNDHDLRTLETGVNVSAIAKYWRLGEAKP